MRILQINKNHYITGGADRVYFNTGNLLEENRNEVLYFSTNHANNVESKFSGYFIPSVDNRSASTLARLTSAGNYLYNRKAFRNLNELIEVCKPDIAHLHLFYGGLSASILKALKENHVPVVQSVHDYRLLCPANAFLDANNNICEKCRNRSYYQCSLLRCNDGNFFYSTILAMEAYFRKYFMDPLEYIDHFIFVSNFARNKHIEFDRRYEGKSTRLYNFTAVPDYGETTGSKNYFFYFGRLSKEKGINTLLNVFQKTGLKLKIAGGGPLADEVSEFARRNPRVEFLGHQSGNNLTELIRGASFVIVPSEWYENNPMTVIEAYFNGIPVIGSAIGGIPEIIIDGKTGFLFESRNAEKLADVLLNASRLDTSGYTLLSQNARNFAEENFSAVAHYDQLMQIYSKVLKNA